MKQKFRRHLLEFFAFCSVLAIAFGLAKPLLHRIDVQLAQYAQNIYELLETTTGLTIHYDSISPSLFKHLKISGIEIKNKKTNDVLFYAKKVILKYDLAFLFKKDFPAAIKQISISNGLVHFQKDTDLELLKTFIFMSSNDLNSIISIDSFDANIKLNNIEILYSDSVVQASFFLKEATAFINNANVEIDLYTYADVSLNNYAHLQEISCTLSSHLSFNLFEKQGNTYLEIKNFDSALFSVETLAFVVSYDNSKIQIDSIQHLQPFDIHANMDLNQPNLTVSLLTENFKPLQWIQLKNKTIVPIGFEHISLTTNSTFAWNQKDGIVYESQLNSVLPKKFYGGGFLDGIIRGNTHSVEVIHASIESNYGNFYFDGNFDFFSKQLDAFASISNLKINQGPEAFFDIYAFGNASYIDLIIPELRIADSSWYSLELVLNPNKDSFDFEFTAMDTSGLISLEGSYAHGTKPFIQLHGGLDSVDVNNSLVFLLFFPRIAENVSSIKKATKDYQITTEIYLSTDFAHVSYTIPRLILASIVQDGNFLLLTADGTESGFALSDLFVNANDFEITGSIISDFSVKKDISLQCSLFFNSLPYDISVFFVDKDVFFYGSYGITGSFLFDNLGGISGRIAASGLPIPIKDVILSLNFDSELTYFSNNEWKVTLETVQLEELSTFLPQKTSFFLSGYVNPYGAFFENIQISDEISRVTGDGFLTMESIKKSLQRFYFELELSSSNTETYSIQGNFLKDSDIFFDAQIMCNTIPLSRFIKGQTNANTASFSGTVSGTPESLFLTALVSNSSFRLSGVDSQIHGLFVYEDNLFHFEDAYFSWKGTIISELSGDFDPLAFVGLVQGKATKIIEKKELQTNIMIELESQNKFNTDMDHTMFDLPSSFSIGVNFSNIKWGTFLIKETFPLFLERNPNQTKIKIGKNNEISGFFYDNGYIFFEASDYSPLNFILDGYVLDNTINIGVTKIALDLGILKNIPTIDYVSINSGMLSGSFTVSGIMSDPDFIGHLEVKDISLELPTIFSENIKPFNFEINGNGKQLVIPEFQVAIEKGVGEVSALVDFDRWFPSQLVAKANVQKQNALPVDIRINQFRVKSNVNGNADLVLNDLGIHVNGSILVEKGFLAANPQISDDEKDKEKRGDDVPLFLDVSIGFGNKMEFRFPNDTLPVIRGLIVAEHPVLLLYDSTTGNYNLKGNASFRGGEVFYFKRNFYLREGKISFNESQAIFDPIVTLRAEVRERDSKGESVRVILSVDNQPLLSFSPHFTSEPIRSEAEILALLGQITTADATVFLDSVIVASDILTQIGIFRTTENTIRDFLNLDIFSIRTLIIQNALFSSSYNQEHNTQKHFGNYFDNTTVYMGKYFGSAIYTDLLAHFYYKNPTNQNTVDEVHEQEEGKLIIQPEIGIEINTPLFLFRWGLSPSNPRTLFVPDNALTFSWKFSY